MSKFYFSMGGPAEPELVKFKDGSFLLPAHIVKFFGGAEKVRERADDFIQFTNLEFMEAAERQVSQQSLNTLSKASIFQMSKRRF
jgi:hypothetical protein